MPIGPDAISALNAVRTAYREGVVPSADYPALLSILGQHLPVDVVAAVATELTVRGIHALTGTTNLTTAISALSATQLPAADVARVARRLGIGG